MPDNKEDKILIMIKNWNEMYMDVYHKLYKLGKDGYDDEDYVLRVAALLGGISYDDLLNLPMSKTREYVENIEFIRKPIPTKSVKGTYTLGENKYKLCMKPDKLTTSQYIDFRAFADDYEENIIPLLATLFVPEGHTYGTGYERDDVERDIREHLSIVDGMAIAAFFFFLYRISMKCSLLYLSRLQRKMMRRAKTEEQKRVAMTMKESIMMMKEMLREM